MTDKMLSLAVGTIVTAPDSVNDVGDTCVIYAARTRTGYGLTHHEVLVQIGQLFDWVAVKNTDRVHLCNNLDEARHLNFSLNSPPSDKPKEPRRQLIIVEEPREGHSSTSV